jgi:hypothetical protein
LSPSFRCPKAQTLTVCSKLGDALFRSYELILEGQLYDLPPYSDPPFPVPESERIVLFDWMVLTCYPDDLEAQVRGRALHNRKGYTGETAEPGDPKEDEARLRFD